MAVSFILTTEGKFTVKESVSFFNNFLKDALHN